MPELPPSGVPEVTVCNVESLFVHVTVAPLETVIVSGKSIYHCLEMKNLVDGNC